MPRQQEEKPKKVFKGYQNPNYTMVPDELFDEHLPELSGAELKVLLYIVRRTFGFKRDSDNISLSQMLSGITTRDGRVLDRGTGLSKKTLLDALRSLEERNLILREQRRSAERGDEPTSYRLNVLTGTRGEETTPPVGEKLHQGGGGKTPPRPWGKNYTTQQTVEQETVEQQTESSNDRSSNLRGRIALQFSKRKVENLENVPDPDRTRTVGPGGTSGLQPIGALISHRRAQELARVGGDAATVEAVRSTRSTTRGRPPTATPYIEQLLTEFSAELHDEEHTRQNIGQAARLWKASGRSESDFCALLYEARSITKQYTVKKRAQGPGGEYGLRNKMPYFFKVLRDLLGMKEHAEGVPRGIPPG